MVKEKQEEILYNENGERVIYKTAPKKRSKFLPGCLGLILLMLLLGMCSALMGDDEKDKDKNIQVLNSEKTTEDNKVQIPSNSSQKKTQVKENPKIGQTFMITHNDKKLQYKVNSIKVQKHYGDKDFGDDANGQFVIANVTIKNLSSESVLISSSDFKLQLNNKKFDTSNVLSAEKSLISEELNPDSEINKDILFDVNSEIAKNPNKKLGITASVWSDELYLVDLK